jgi:hypothetical protein
VPPRRVLSLREGLVPVSQQTQDFLPTPYFCLSEFHLDREHQDIWDILGQPAVLAVMWKRGWRGVGYFDST